MSTDSMFNKHPRLAIQLLHNSHLCLGLTVAHSTCFMKTLADLFEVGRFFVVLLKEKILESFDNGRETLVFVAAFGFVVIK